MVQTCSGFLLDVETVLRACGFRNETAGLGRKPACIAMLWGALSWSAMLPFWGVFAAMPDEGRGLGSMSKRPLPRIGTHSAQDPGPMPDLGARWRIKIVGSARYLYKHESSFIASAAFFSLFELRSNGDGSYMIADHAGNWVHALLPTDEDRLPRITLLPPAPPAPPSPGLSSQTNVGSMPPVKLQPLFLKEHESGAYAFLLSLDGGSFLCQDQSNPLNIVTCTSPDPSSPPHKSSWWPLTSRGGLSTPLTGINSSSLFELQRVIGESICSYSGRESCSGTNL